VNGLMRGLTNKELAAELRISTHTVKEYIRQIMMKVKTTSRTGIVARVAGLTLSMQPGCGPRAPEAPSRIVQAV
jgi:DNA-binding NarL/FixJ family response regulator